MNELPMSANNFVEHLHQGLQQIGRGDSAW